MPSVAEYVAFIAAEQAAREAAREAAKKRKGRSRDFYASAAWRTLRYAALRANREKYGQLTCEACGGTEGPFHGDHIVPLSKDWSRRLDRSNLQVMCELCNLGKSNTDSLDWRPENRSSGPKPG